MTKDQEVFVSASAQVDTRATVGIDSKIWDLAQVREHAVVGERVIVGRAAYVGPGVVIGDDCKLQNLALVYEPARLGRGVFVGPAAVLTNDQYPRAINPDGSQKSTEDWDIVGVTVEDGASIGARSVCVAPIRIGSWSLVAAGSTVIRDVPAFAIVAGAPARRIGWVGRAGVPLRRESDTAFICPKTGVRYRLESDDVLVEEIP